MRQLKLANSKPGGGYLGNKGFAVSGILYPILILTVFLVVQVLTMMASRKSILDESRKQLLDSVNASNKVYTNEELSILLGEQQSKIEELEQKQSNNLNKAYPVGSIYISYSATNPSSLFGGTWIAYAAGKTLVGVDTGQAEFNTIGKTGGEKTHTLTIDEIPSHTGHANPWPTKADSYYLSTPKLMELGIMMSYPNRAWQVMAGNELDFKTEAKGSSQAHNNLQPYITTYMWRRTA